MDVRLVRDPTNSHDPMAIRVECRQAIAATPWKHVGFIPNKDKIGLASVLAPAMDSGAEVVATVLEAGRLERDEAVPWIKLGLHVSTSVPMAEMAEGDYEDVKGLDPGDGGAAAIEALLAWSAKQMGIDTAVLGSGRE